MDAENGRTIEMIPALILSCLIVAVPDGDTVHARCDGDAKPQKVRITRMDAPERKHLELGIAQQPYGDEAQKALLRLCYGKTATVAVMGHDMYRRTLAAVSCDGVDVADRMIRDGLAWAYRPAKRSPLRAVEAEARAAGLGLWADPQPVAPWVWRKAGRAK